MEDSKGSIGKYLEEYCEKFLLDYQKLLKSDSVSLLALSYCESDDDERNWDWKCEEKDYIVAPSRNGVILTYNNTGILWFLCNGLS